MQAACHAYHALQTHSLWLIIPWLCTLKSDTSQVWYMSSHIEMQTRSWPVWTISIMLLSVKSGNWIYITQDVCNACHELHIHSLILLTLLFWTFHLRINACRVPISPLTLVLITQAIFLLKHGQTDRQTDSHNWSHCLGNIYYQRG